MKKVLFLIVFLQLSNASFGQTCRAIFLNPNVYRTMTDLKAVRILGAENDSIYNDSVTIKTNGLPLDYKIINEDVNGSTIIRILPKVEIITKDGKTVVQRKTGYQTTTETSNAYLYYFAIKKDAFGPLSKTLLSNKIVGMPLIHPFKLRPSKGSQGWNLGGEFTVSYTFGYRRKLGSNPFSQNFISFIPIGFGVGGAKYFKETPDGSTTEKIDALAVTYWQAGVLLTIQKVNFGIFTGLDAMIDKQNDWFYQSKPWFSFGLGYKFKTD